MKETSYEELINSIRNNHFVVYGAGSHADKFLQILKHLGFEDNYLYSAVTRKDKDDKAELRLIHEVDRNKLIMIAAHDKNAKQMEQTLKELGFRNYYLIYPHLIELVCGLPYKKNVDINVSEFLKNCLYGNYLAIIYLAIDDIMNNNKIGQDLYLKYMNNYSNSDTSKKRLESLRERACYISQCHKNEDYNIKINPNEHFLLDGSHRIVLAKYFGIKTIKADLYNTSIEHYEFFLGKGGGMSIQELNRLFSPNECECIINTRINKFEQKQ